MRFEPPNGCMSPLDVLKLSASISNVSCVSSMPGAVGVAPAMNIRPRVVELKIEVCAKRGALLEIAGVQRRTGM